jgi:DNA primase
MRFPPSFIDEIRARVPVSEVVRRRVPLKKAGREWKGLSPFNAERTPSFFVNDQKGFYHCFSSGKSGDQFRFLMETEGLSFPEAVERLAHLAGLAVPKSSPEAEKKEARRKTLHDVVELAAKYFEAQMAAPGGKRAREYASRRGLKEETLREFRIGYAPGSRSGLREYLEKQSVSVRDMIEAGLLVAGEDIPVPYDRFRDRLIIPIHDHRGRVIAFGGRAIDSEVQPKYLNSPETPLFHKGGVVFNFHRAREAAHQEEFLVAVEGYLDAIAVYQAGMKTVVATMGTAFTEEQIELLWRLAPEPLICFDGDKAGRAAADRSLERILPLLRTGVSFRFAFLPSSQDPDDVVRKQGLQGFATVLKNAESLWDRLWEREYHRRTIQTPDHKATFEKAIFDLVGLIGEKRVRESYRFRARAQLVALFQSLDWREAIKKKKLTSSPELALQPASPLVSIEKILLGTLLHYHDSLLDVHIERLMLTEFTGKRETFKREIYRIYFDFKDHSPSVFYKEINEEYREVFVDIYGPVDGHEAKPEAIYRRFPLLSLEPPLSFVDRCVNLFFQMLSARQMQNEIDEVQGSAERANDPAELERLPSLVGHLHEVKSQIIALDHVLADEAHQLRRQFGSRPSRWVNMAADKALSMDFV